MSFPGWQFANRGRSIHAGQQGGMHMLRDLPRYVKLIEKGVIDRVMEAVQAVADRTQVGAVVTF